MNYYQNPYWYKLIKTFKNAPSPYKISTGLTIPFLMGAYKELNVPFDNISDLLISILDTEIDKYPVLEVCSVINQHVLAVENKSIYNRPATKTVKIQSTLIRNSLIIGMHSSALGNTLPKISQNLHHQYSSQINSGLYSYNNHKKKWFGFDKEEIKLIKSVL